MILSAVLLASLIFALLKWFAYFNSTAGLLHYMQVNQIRLPNDEELKSCAKWAVKHLIDDLFKRS